MKAIEHWSHQSVEISYYYSLPHALQQTLVQMSCEFLFLVSFSSPASRSARDPEEESSQRLSERRRGAFYHRKELPQRNQSYFSGEYCRYQLGVVSVVLGCILM